MFELNPHNLIDAWWQHLLMIVVSTILGYIIGSRQGRFAINQLEDQLARTAVKLEKCRKNLVVLQPKILAAQLSGEPDDLKLVEGIGPKIEILLNIAGIHTFAQLSSTSVDQLRKILEDAGSRYSVHKPDTWPDQAALAREGRWEELAKWQQEMDGGVQ